MVLGDGLQSFHRQAAFLKLTHVPANSVTGNLKDGTDASDTHTRCIASQYVLKFSCHNLYIILTASQDGTYNIQEIPVRTSTDRVNYILAIWVSMKMVSRVK